MTTFKRVIMLLLSLSLMVVPAAYGASGTLYITHAGAGTFVLKATNLQNIGSIDIEVRYNPSVLASPNSPPDPNFPGKGVTQGGPFGGFVANSLIPGSIRIGAIAGMTPINGDVTIATLTFPSEVGTVNSSAIYIQNYRFGDMSTSPVGVVNAGIDPDQSNPGKTDGGNNQNQNQNQNQSDGTTTPTGSGSGSGLVSLGTVTMTPSGQETGSGEKPRADKAKGSEQAETPASPEEPHAEPSVAKENEQGGGAAEKQDHVRFRLPEYPGVLASFRDFHGEQTPKAMMGLANAKPPKELRQVPSIILSDGKTPVKVYVQFPADVKTTPNFALRGAKLLSLKREGADWVVEALPKTNAYDVSLTVLYDDAVSVVPLTVVPSIDHLIRKGLAMDEQGFAQFLKERGTDKAPKFDLNGDGKRTYLDDYIYTLNYVLRLTEKERKKK